MTSSLLPGVEVVPVGQDRLVGIPDEDHSSVLDVVLSPAQIVLPVIRVQQGAVVSLLEQGPAIVGPAVLSQEPGIVQSLVYIDIDVMSSV